MRPDDVPLLALLRQEMNYSSDRQRVIANNVANANTPGFVAQDLDRAEFERSVSEVMSQRRSANGMRLRTTRDGHIQGPPAVETSTRSWSTQDTPDSETTINGNSVVLEEQMVKANETRMRYESALSLYQKSLGLIRTAIRPPS